MRCCRPGCLEPQIHFLAPTRRINKRWVALHSYDCRVPFPGVTVGSVAKQAISELRPGMEPSEVAVARRVIGKMLDRLEQLEHTVVTVTPPAAPLLLTAAKERKRPPRPQVVREITHARESHLEWLAQQKERTA